MTVLLDANVLIALVVSDHVHHEQAETWFLAETKSVATCPITEGSLVRLVVREGQSARSAQSLLTRLSAHPRHEFWPDDLRCEEIRLDGVVGHRQVTDAYLAELARIHGGRLATFDGGLAALHADVATHISTT